MFIRKPLAEAAAPAALTTHSMAELLCASEPAMPDRKRHVTSSLVYIRFSGFSPTTCRTNLQMSGHASRGKYLPAASAEHAPSLYTLRVCLHLASFATF